MIDVLVAGAGPAGSVAAAILAGAGARVALFDRARFPRDKLCGDTLNPGALERLRALGLDRGLDELAIPIEGMIVTGPGGACVKAPYSPGRLGRAVVRRRLDSHLLSCAMRAGAHFEEGMNVRAALVGTGPPGSVVTGALVATRIGRSVRMPAHVTIAADGRRSSLAFTLGLAIHPRRPRRWAIGSYVTGIADLTAFGEMHVRQGHYLGVAPLADDLANVCLVTADRRGFEDPGSRLRETIDQDPMLRDRFVEARFVGPTVAMGPLAVEARAAGMPGLLLAGDAGGFIDPMTGDGLRFAIRGAELAARAALEMLEHGPQRGYRSLSCWRAREFSAKWRFNKTLRALVGSEIGISLATRGGSAVPALVRRLVTIAGDAA